MRLLQLQHDRDNIVLLFGAQVANADRQVDRGGGGFGAQVTDPSRTTVGQAKVVVGLEVVDQSAGGHGSHLQLVLHRAQSVRETILLFRGKLPASDGPQKGYLCATLYLAVLLLHVHAAQSDLGPIYDHDLCVHLDLHGLFCVAGGRGNLVGILQDQFADASGQGNGE